MYKTLLLMSLSVSGCSLGLSKFTPPEDVGAGGEGGGGSSGGGADGGADSFDTDDLDTDGGGGSGGGSGSLSITDADPAWGVSDGGLAVKLKGSGFSSSTTATIGGESASVASQTSTTLTVSSPSYSGSTDLNTNGYEAVDIKVKDGGDSDSLAGGFTYYLDGDGKAGAFGTLGWYHWTASAKAGFSDGSSLTDSGAASIYFISPPTNIHWWDVYAPSSDDCTDDTYDFSTAFGDVYFWNIGPNSISLKPSSGTAMTLAYDDSYGGYVNSADLSSGQVPQGTSYELQEVEAGYAPEAFTVSDAMKSGSSFTLSTPMLESSTLPLMSQSSLTFSWSGGTTGQRLMFDLALLNSSGTTLAEIYCVAADDGSFTVPSADWGTTWPRGSYLLMYVGRVVEGTGTLPYNNAEMRIAGIYWQVGLGYIP